MIPPDAVRRAATVLEARGSDFAALSAKAGLNPARHWQGANLRDVDFRADDLRGFNFQQADFTGASLARQRNLDPRMFKGAIWDATTVWPAGFRDVFAPWVADAGRDKFGLWVTFAVGGANQKPVTQRLRWIPPGRFLRGSPLDEDGRWDDEGPQRPVTIAQGFWLFDTPCTQELWKAVMGNNPSEFQTPTRPVETVSFTIVQEFLVKVNGVVPGLNLSLPSEAQWEHACRAATIAPTFAGPNTPEVLDTIGWYDANSSGKLGTGPVAQKLPNDWGLYDMLGNVLEWCADHWHDSYDGAPDDSSPRLDAGSDEGAAYRVVRGGAWGSVARGLRAAYRSGLAPGSAGGYLGFRCARVQVLSEAAAQGREEQARSAERRAATTSPERDSRGGAAKRRR